MSGIDPGEGAKRTMKLPYSGGGIGLFRVGRGRSNTRREGIGRLDVK